MGRKLPWKRAEEEPKSSAVKTESPRSVKRKSPSSFSTPSRPKRVTPPQSALSSRIRSPSTSPPPEPPKEEFMVASDDRYRIVEDEFLHTAQKFTAHLHRAEYQRLKTLAASQNADTIRAIERPVVGPPSRVTKQRAEVTHKVAKQRTLTGSKDDQPYLSTGLRGLMESPRKEVRSIKAPGKSTIGTRAAAGFGSQGSPSRPSEEMLLIRPTGARATTAARDRVGSPSRRKSEAPMRKHRVATEDSDTNIDTTDEDSNNDLGSVSTSRVRGANPETSAGTRTIRTTSNPSTSTKTISKAKSAPNLKQTTGNEPAGVTTQTIGINDEGNDDEDDDPFGIRKMRVRRAKSRDQMRKPTAEETVDLIPSFL